MWGKKAEKKLNFYNIASEASYFLAQKVLDSENLINPEKILKVCCIQIFLQFDEFFQ